MSSLTPPMEMLESLSSSPVPYITCAEILQNFLERWVQKERDWRLDIYRHRNDEEDCQLNSNQSRSHLRHTCPLWWLTHGRSCFTDEKKKRILETSCFKCLFLLSCLALWTSEFARFCFLLQLCLKYMSHPALEELTWNPQLQTLITYLNIRRD